MFNPIWILKQPWFAISPSPWSIAFYVLMGILGSRKLLKAGVPYKRLPRLMAFLDSIFILGIVVFIQDTIWLLANTWKWIIPLYLDTATFSNYWIRFPQNILGALFLFLIVSGLWQHHYWRFNRRFWMWIGLIACYTFLVFQLAPSQSFTDWTYGINYGASDTVILEAFLISHVGYKLLIAAAFLSLFVIEDKTISIY